jgi:hypothetical protein
MDAVWPLRAVLWLCRFCVLVLLAVVSPPFKPQLGPHRELRSTRATLVPDAFLDGRCRGVSFPQQRASVSVC